MNHVHLTNLKATISHCETTIAGINADIALVKSNVCKKLLLDYVKELQDGLREFYNELDAVDLSKPRFWEVNGISGADFLDESDLDSYLAANVKIYSYAAQEIRSLPQGMSFDLTGLSDTDTSIRRVPNNEVP